MALTHSPYLNGIQQQFQAPLDALPSNRLDALKQLISQTSQLDIHNDFAQQLRALKAQFAFCWATARLSRGISSTILGELQTTFAEISIDKALQAAWAEPQFAQLLTKGSQAVNGAIPGLFILGLGKLGGYDLNFSSDVDLIAFYDPDQLPVSSVHGRADVCSRVLTKLTQILSKSIDGRFVWRVDWRLRPNASTMSLSMPVDLAEDFYFFHSMPWHRLALIKARVIAGDIASGEKFLNTLEPYLWRQNLDFQTIDEIHQLKSKINLEHPQLKQARNSGQLYNQQQGEGFNLKLGHGGIREIEFIVNATQLIWGGKKPSLRITSTVSLLRQICTLELMDKKNSAALIDAYQYFRWLEDVIQIVDNFQEHKLPTDQQKLNAVLSLSQITNQQQFWQQLEAHRRTVTSFFNNTFSQSQAEVHSTSQWLEPDWITALPATQQRLCEAWSKGFLIYAVNPKQAESLYPLFISICNLLEEATVNRILAIDKLHAFFKAIPKGGQYFRLLTQHPKLLDDIAKPLIHSPHMTNLLEQSPHIVDYLLEPKTNDLKQLDFQDDSQFILQTTDFEFRLERLRRFVNEQLYAACLQLLHGSIGAIQLQQRLTKLAEHTLNLGIIITNQDMGLSEAPIAVLGLGKLGMRAMAPMSDLDLIFIADDNIEPELAARYSRRLQLLMEMRSKEGRAYEMDMRLRPSGQSGPVTVSLSSFEHYHHNRAKTWEHLALTAARAVAGPEALQQKIQCARADILAKPRDKQQLKLDAAKMLWRLQAQRIGKSSHIGLDVKLRSGGLMELDYLSACICLLSQPKPEISILSYDQMIIAVFKHLQHADNLTPSTTEQPSAADIQSATNFWRKLQIWSRVFGLDNIHLNQLNPSLLHHLLNDMECSSLHILENKIVSMSKSVSHQLKNMTTEFEQQKPTNWDNWIESPIKWSNELINKPE